MPGRRSCLRMEFNSGLGSWIQWIRRDWRSWPKPPPSWEVSQQGALKPRPLSRMSLTVRYFGLLKARAFANRFLPGGAVPAWAYTCADQRSEFVENTSKGTHLFTS